MRLNDLAWLVTLLYGLSTTPSYAHPRSSTNLSSDFAFSQPETAVVFQPEYTRVPSRPLGTYNAGSLYHSVQLPEREWIKSEKRGKDYGTNELVDLIDRTGFSLYNNYGAPLIVHDLSKPEGGHLRPHKSHQNGLDVDVGLYFWDTKKQQYGNKFACLPNVNQNTLEANWNFIRGLQLEEAPLKAIFWRQRYINALHKHVTQRYGPEEWEKFGRVLQHQKGHRDHFHIRLEKPAVEYNIQPKT